MKFIAPEGNPDDNGTNDNRTNYPTYGARTDAG